jgi:hypothetical protein
MRSPGWGLGLVALLALSACVIWVDPDDSELDARVVRAAAEVNRHHARIEDAVDLAGARAEVARHDVEMHQRLNEVRAELHGDWRCDWGGMDDMRGMMDSTEALFVDYLDAVDAAGDLADVRALCDAYSDAMDHALSRMMDHWDDMRCDW